MPELSSASASVPSLRFPKPQGSQRLANWISSSAPDIMSQVISGLPGDDEVMAESSYELVNTDGETESVASSLDLVADRLTPHDDMVSLAGTDNTNEKENDTPEDDSTDDDEAGEYRHLWLPPNVDLEYRLHAVYLRTEPQLPPDDLDTPSHTVQDLPSSQPSPPSPVGPTADPASKEDPPKSQPGRKGLVQLIGALLDDPNVEHWRRILRLVVVAALIAVLFHTLFPVAGDSGGSCHATKSTTTRPTTVTLVATPATVTVTVTSTSTVQLSSIHELGRKIASTADEAARTMEGACVPALLSMAARIWNNATAPFKSLGEAASRSLPEKALYRLTKSINIIATRLQNHASLRASRSLKSFEALTDDLNFNILKAQIKSWLICLRLRGDVAEYKRYEARAVEHLRAKHRELMDKRVQVDKAPSQSTSPRGFNLRWSAT